MKTLLILIAMLTLSVVCWGQGWTEEEIRQVEMEIMADHHIDETPSVSEIYIMEYYSDTLKVPHGKDTLRVYFNEDGEMVWYCNSGIVIDGGGPKNMGRFMYLGYDTISDNELDTAYWELIQYDTLWHHYKYQRIPDRWECRVDTVWETITTVYEDTIIECNPCTGDVDTIIWESGLMGISWGITSIDTTYHPLLVPYLTEEQDKFLKSLIMDMKED